MKKSILGFLMLFIAVLFVPVGAKAMDDSYFFQKEGKPVVNINGNNFYFSVGLETNIKGNSVGDFVPINNVQVNYTNDIVYVTIKRSEINKILKSNNYANVSASIIVEGYYLDIDKSKKYYFFWGDFDNSKYYYETSAANYDMRTNNALEVFSTGADLGGFDPFTQKYSSGGMVLFEADEFPSNYNVGDTYSYDQIDFSNKPIINMASKKIVIGLMEDEVMDFGKNKVVLRKGSGNANDDTVVLENVDVNNYYANYLDDNRLNYSWTMYDKNGNPIELDVNTDIAVDKSKNEDKILSLIPSRFKDIKNRIKIISFAQDGDLNGVAKISIYVGDKFKPKSVLRLYYFNPDSELLEERTIDADNADGFYDIVVDRDGYITLTFTHCSEYVLTDLEVAKVLNNTDQKNQKVVNQNIANFYLIVSMISVAVLAIVIIIIFLLRKTKKSR